MSTSIRKIVIGGSVFSLCCVGAVLGYQRAGWTLLESVYMVVITIFGVGYGEVHPVVEPWLRVFTMLVIVVGSSSLIYVTGGFIQMLTEGEIDRALGTHRRTKGIDRLSGHTIVCGFGRVGRILAAELRRAEQSFVVVDASAERIKEAESLSYLVVTGNATEETVLENAGIARARVLASVLPDDAANVFITLTARELNSSIEIIARAENPATERKLLRSGATRVVLPSAIGAQRISQLISNPSVEQMLSQGGERLKEDLGLLGLSLTEATVPEGPAIAGSRIGEIEFRSDSKALLVALIRVSGEVMREPPAGIAVGPGDRLIFVANGSKPPELYRRSGDVLKYRGGARG
jgi:voltage-gated potassium channel